MELLDLYDRDRKLLGRTMERGTVQPENTYRLVVHVLVFDRDGNLLIQQRQPFKKGWSNLWDVSVGGHAVSGDSSSVAAGRELFEELGIVHGFENERPVLTTHWDNGKSRGFDDYYVLNKDVDLEKLVLQTEEVQAVKWATLEEILEMVEKKQFIPYCRSLLELLFYYRNTRDNHTCGDWTRPV